MSNMRELKADRATERAAVSANNSETQQRLELQYIADALEGIRQDLHALVRTVAESARTVR
jgi:hypothetical protein